MGFAAMHFLPARKPRPDPMRDHPLWRWLLFAGAAVGAAASAQPWTEVRYARLFGEQLGPPAWQCSAGFTSLCTCALVVVLALAESTTRASREAVRPASLLLVAVMTGALLLHAWPGPGTVRGVTAAWTISFYASLVGVLAVAAASVMRFLAARQRGGRLPTTRDPIADGS